jgi:hypothetical protein
MPATDFVPAKDQDLKAFTLNFSTKITAAPATYGLTAGQATAFAALYATFATALTAATDPATRTSVTVAAKDTARQAIVFSLRQLARVVQSTPGISPANLETLGLTVRQTVPTPIPPPTTKPVVAVERTLSQALQCRFSDETTPTSRSKPFGAVSCEVRATAALVPPASADAATFKGMASRVPFTISFDAGDVGKTAYIYARWLNAKGEVGPWSTVTTSTIAA